MLQILFLYCDFILCATAKAKGELRRCNYSLMDTGLLTVSGLPADVPFKRPGEYVVGELKAILANEDSISMHSK